MTYPLTLVAEWHDKFQVATPSEPTLSAEVGAIRTALLTEECNELINAIAARDRLETLDALCDIQYVLSGTVLALGLRAPFVTKLNESPARRISGSPIAFRAALLLLKVCNLGVLICGNSVNGVLSNLHDCQMILDGIVASGGFSQFEAAFLAVHTNNWEKTWSADEMRDLPFRYTFSTHQEGAFIVKDSAGKVRKPPNHPKVDLTPFI